MSSCFPSGPEAVLGGASGPVTDRAFAAVLERIGGFEPAPRIAVAVSGGPDSLALCLLADAWCRAHAGTVVALTVDHGLRPESAREAAQVRTWLQARGIAHEMLVWIGAKPLSGVQAAARAARYRLLAGYCRDHGIRHLLLGHQLEDQAETFLLRLGMSSGVDGLAGMAAVRADGPVRLVRPLLGVPKSRLEATCRAVGQAWIEDPSNQAEAFTRVRLRKLLGDLEAAGVGPGAIVASMAKLAEDRAALEAVTATLLSAAADLRPEGWLLLDRRPLRTVPAAIARRAVQRCLRCIGGRAYPLRSAAVARLTAALLDEPSGKPFTGTTLGGCRLLSSPRAGRVPSTDGEPPERVLICREPAAISARRVPLTGPVRWDRRFDLAVTGPGAADGLAVAAVGSGLGRTALQALSGLPGLANLPAPVLSTLPGLWRDDRLAGLPTMAGSALERPESAAPPPVAAIFRPGVALRGPASADAWTEGGETRQNDHP